MIKNILSTVLLSIILVSPVVGVISAQEDATDEASVIREKVKEKIENVRNNPKAYFGTITDITDTTLQLNDDDDEILQVSIQEEDASFLNIVNDSKDVEFEDLAIGDYIVAMGFKNGNDVLEARRVLITSPLKLPARKITYATVNKIEKKTIYLQDKDEEEYVLEFPRRWKGPEIDEFEEGTDVIVVYAPDEDGELFVRTIEVASQPQPSPTPEEELE